MLARLPLILFVIAIALSIFGYGVLVERQRVFPYWIIHDGIKTGQALFDSRTVEFKSTIYHIMGGGGQALLDSRTVEFQSFSEVPPAESGSKRVEFVAGNGLTAPILWTGGRSQFSEYCPGGCLAVEYSRTGEVAHAYPLRLDELEKVKDRFADRDEFPYEYSPSFSFVRNTYPIGISRYSNGDLLVVFQHYNDSFPYGAGVARIDRDGHVIWFRSDYSHHWPYLLDDGTALVPSLRIGKEPIVFPLRDRNLRLGDCDSPYRDTVHIIDGDGRLLKHIDLLDALLVSPYLFVLRHSSNSNSCDLLHLNFIHRLGEDTGGAWGIGPGDLVVSLRNLSVFAILDQESGYVKRVVRGNFLHQHSVHHLEGSTFLMFDNWGQDEVGGPSRLLMIDLADGRETTIFPNQRSPESLRDLFSSSEGTIDISADHRRVLITFAGEGMGVEVRLSDGEILNIFRSCCTSGQVLNVRESRNRLFHRMYGLHYIHE